jgi:FkbM family methyltransferase
MRNSLAGQTRPSISGARKREPALIQSFKKTLRELLHALWRPSRPALYGMDRKLERHLGSSPGFFIEAGANDGYQQSNTYYLERRRGWHGILVEGIPELYSRCKRLRKRSTVLNCALVSSNYERPTVTMHYAHLMSVVDGAMRSPEAQDRHLGLGRDLQGLTSAYSVEVPARTLESVLAAIPDLPPIDLLSLDVEGYELQVLEGMNLERFSPRHILVEARFFDEVNAFLSPRYELIDRLSHHDYLYRRRTGAAPAAP